MLFPNKYFVLFIALIFLAGFESQAQIENTISRNKSNITLDAKQQPSDVKPTATKVFSDNQNEDEVIVKKTMAVNQQPSNVTPTVKKIESDNKKENRVVVYKTEQATKQPVNVTPTVKKVESGKTDKPKNN